MPNEIFPGSASTGARTRKSPMNSAGCRGAGPSRSTADFSGESMTTAVVFVPLMFLTGLAGIIFKQLSFVLSITILGSLFTALTPMLSAQGNDDETGFFAGFRRISEKGFVALEGWYEALLAWALSHQKLVLGMTLAVFATSLSLIQRHEDFDPLFLPRHNLDYLVEISFLI